MIDNSTEPKIHSSQTWAAPVVSVMIMGAFLLGLWLTFHTPGEATSTQIGMVEALKVLATLAAGYWLGSSSGSERKTDMIYRSTPAAAPPGTTTTTTTPDPVP